MTNNNQEQIYLTNDFEMQNVEPTENCESNHETNNNENLDLLVKDNLRDSENREDITDSQKKTIETEVERNSIGVNTTPSLSSSACYMSEMMNNIATPANDINIGFNNRLAPHSEDGLNNLANHMQNFLRTQGLLDINTEALTNMTQANSIDADQQDNWQPNAIETMPRRENFGAIDEGSNSDSNSANVPQNNWQPNVLDNIPRDEPLDNINDDVIAAPSVNWQLNDIPNMPRNEKDLSDPIYINVPQDNWKSNEMEIIPTDRNNVGSDGESSSDSDTSDGPDDNWHDMAQLIEQVESKERDLKNSIIELKNVIEKNAENDGNDTAIKPKIWIRKDLVNGEDDPISTQNLGREEIPLIEQQPRNNSRSNNLSHTYDIKVGSAHESTTVEVRLKTNKRRREEPPRNDININDLDVPQTLKRLRAYTHQRQNYLAFDLVNQLENALMYGDFN